MREIDEREQSRFPKNGVFKKQTPNFGEKN